jgi:serine/threonine protein kinase
MAITEFCGDFNIATSAKEQPLAHNDIAGLIKQVSEGLEYLHNKDMAHGNLKPSNILVRTRQPLDVAIGDVGTPGNNEWLRQPHYLAPEIVPSPGQERGQEQGRDARPADVWALGVITLEVLEGSMLSMENAYRYPYNVSRHVSKSRRPPGSEAALIILIQGMLKNNPKNRLTATECRKEAEALLRSLAAAFPDQNCAVARGADENPGADQNDRAGRVSEMGNGKEVDRGKDIDGGKELDKASGSGGAMTDGITGGSGDNTPGPSKAIARRQSKRKSATTPNQNRAPSPKRHLR